MATRDASHNAAGVAYFAIFSLFPLLLGVLSILGMVLASEELQQRCITFATSNLPDSAQFVESNLEEIIRFRGALGVGAILSWGRRSVTSTSCFTGPARQERKHKMAKRRSTGSCRMGDWVRRWRLIRV